MDKKTNQEAFGSNAAAYVNSPTHARGASLKRLGDLVETRPEWEVLDVATGTGHTALIFAPRVARVWATDITAQMLAQVKIAVTDRGFDNIVIGFADVEELPFRDKFFDVITCRIAAHHFPDIPSFLAETRRVLRPGGLLAVVDNIVPAGSAGDYINAFEKLRDSSHGRCLSVSEWRTAFIEKGFSILHEETLFKEMMFDYWAQRHGPQFQHYLLAMLSEVHGEAATFLQPHLISGRRTFRLCEGIFIARSG